MIWRRTVEPHLQTAMKGFSLGASGLKQEVPTQSEVMVLKKNDILEKLTQNSPKIESEVS